MSNLIKPYEIAVYEDVFEGGVFKEKRLGIIGSNAMTSLDRVLEPVLTRNINGQKSLTFKMYKRYIDTETGEEKENPFSEWLINERKVKLKYGTHIEDGVEKDTWYDFIIKNVVENSSTYLYTYQLEDALVLELSKNGFGVTLDETLNNNLGTVEVLANKVLDGSGWTVKSEKFIQTVEEPLVYIKIPANTPINKITDRTDYNQGITTSSTSFTEEKTALAFYSCCTGKPHRFQFIILNSYDKDKVKVNTNRVIIEKNCQYYVDLSNPEKMYTKVGDYEYYLPKVQNTYQFSLFNKGSQGTSDSNDTTVSNWYRGARYGFAQQVEYLPVIDRYCNKYIKSGKEYYGFVDNQYIAPVLIQNIITNPDFKSTSGWTGTYVGNSPNMSKTYAVELTDEYGRFNSGKFTSVITDLENGIDPSKQSYSSYLKADFKADSTLNYGAIINSGFYDHRTSIGSVTYNEEWIISAEIYDSTYKKIDAVFDVFNFELREAQYNAQTGGYLLNDIWATTSSNGIMKFNSTNPTTGYADVEVSAEDFKNKKIQLIISRKTPGTAATYYIKKIELYKKYLDKDEKPITIGSTSGTEGLVINTHFLFPKEELANTSIKSIEDIACEKIEEIDYSVYVPVYNEGAQQVRTIKVKESNYFNNLQTIAETFEAWMLLSAKRNTKGEITEKVVSYKNYAGENNYASFRYGVNLKDIQRTYESKNIVTKLIVKQNKNEHAKGGFCTIARATSNPTSEDYIYDFQYYHNQELLDSRDYIDVVYDSTNAQGTDLNPTNTTTWNLQGYAARVKSLNNKIIPLGEEIGGLQLELTELEAKKAVSQAALDAANTGIQEVQSDFYTMSGGLMPDQISPGDFSSITCQLPNVNDDDKGTYTKDGTLGTNALNATKDWAQGATVTVQEGESKVNWNFSVQLQTTTKPSNGVTINPTQFAVYGSEDCWDESNSKLTLSANAPQWAGIYLEKWDVSADGTTWQSYEKDKEYWLEYFIKQSCTVTGDDNIEVSSGTLKRIGGHRDAFADYSISVEHYEEVKTADGQKSQKLINIYTSNDSFVELPPVVVDPKIPGDTLAAAINRTYYKVTVHGVYANPTANNPQFFIQPNREYSGADAQVTCEISGIKIYEETPNVSKYDRTFKFQPIFTLTPKVNEGEIAIDIVQNPILSCTIPSYSTSGSLDYTLAIVDTKNGKIADLLKQYCTYIQEIKKATGELNGKDGSVGYLAQIEAKEQSIKNKNELRDTYIEYKKKLNSLFYQRYSRFIQEGTWVDEEYVDDEKYYNDALSVLYNSCYPQVVYNINVLELSQLPGYEMFSFELGDKTYVEDPHFFGSEHREEVIISGLTNQLDDPSKDSVKVQNFKNQFQDLFQKITATVQQAQYSEGAYQKAVALAEASAQKKNEFVNAALGLASAKLKVGGQESVYSDTDGITITDLETQEKLRMIGGAILMGTKDATTGEQVWRTGLTPQGISASLLTAGTINTSNIAIMNGSEPVFRWDAYGLTAYDAVWSADIVSAPNKSKFVRFDKHGIYGISPTATENIDGTSWRPSSAEEIDEKANFMLTWDGLKVIGNDGVIIRLGRNASSYDTEGNVVNNNIFSINKDTQTLMSLNGNGTLKVGTWSVSQDGLETEETQSLEEAATYSLRGRASSISSGTESLDPPKAFLSAKGRILSVGQFTGTSDGSDTANIVFKAGNRFMVTDEGVLYANAGWIGPMKIGDIKTKIDAAQSTADTAKSTADTAQGTANTASQKADSASQKADSAQQTANGKMSPSVTTGTYHWTFDSTNGITMTSGETEVFKVGNIDGQNALKIKGRIESDSGYIGSWSLGPFSLEVNETTWTGKGIFYEGSTSGLGRTIVSPGQIHFATGDTSEQQHFTFFSGGGGVHGYFSIHGATMSGSYALDRDLSDMRMKNSIEQLSNQYEVFFDFMEPARYKYNNGTSGRYHVGFIAQQLVDSLNKSGLSTQDFAGMMLRYPGQEEECWYLRHNEFVALNTWQIQKLKPRVSTLEQTILNYEARISNLEAEIQNLKSS